MGYNVTSLVTGGAVRPIWLADGRFWYRNPVRDGNEFVLVDPVGRTRELAFDHGKLAAALTIASGVSYQALRLPFLRIDFSADGQAVGFDLGQRRWSCDRAGSRCAGAGRPADALPRNASASPDGKRVVYIKDWNLWARELASGKESQLTTDGIKDFGYATDNAGWTSSDRPIVLWSPDSKKIATFQQDQRGVGEMYLVDTKVGHSTLRAWKYPLPGDSVITTIQRVIIEVEGPRVVRLQMPTDQHRSTTCDDVACGGTWGDVQWNADGTQLAFVSSSRDHKSAWLRLADAATGAVREVMSETVPTFFESGYNRVNWRYLPASNEVLWYSQRSDWGHLYLYDLTTGALKLPITAGRWNVLQVLRVDEKERLLWFLGAGREPGDPYFRYLYRVRFDGKDLRLLSPDSADHDIGLPPAGRHFVDNYSRPETPTVSVLRDAEGRLVLPLERMDISRLVATGWRPPTPFSVKARDAKTDLYGLLYRPTNFDSTRKYPIINHIYPGPQTGSVAGRSFSAARSDAQAIAELGFVVVQLDAMGTPMRSKSFHAAYYGNMGDNGLPDQVTGMQQLAGRHRWIDLERAGIWGHSGGGFASAAAMFRYPDFFKVGVSQAGNHDNRQYEDDWAEKWQGLLVRNPDGTTNYDNQANQLVAKNLKGKLLLAHGTMDNNVPPFNTLLVADALIKANKDFDMLMLPNRTHGFGNEPYMVRRRWDYFVRHLLGAEPPKEYEFRAPGTTPPPIP